MKEQTELLLTAVQLNLMKHSLGLDDSKKIENFKKTKDSYRNRFCAGEKHSDYPNLKVLCDMKLMDHSEPLESIGGIMYFYVTDKGIEELIKFL